MRREGEMIERWFFYQDGAGLWKWARLDVLGTVLAHSGSSFETRDACVEHASLHGYGTGKEPPRASTVTVRVPARGTRSPRPNRPA